jgi:subtilisin family serine protease
VDVSNWKGRASTGEENRIAAASVEPLGANRAASINPAAYQINNVINGLSSLHLDGKQGQGITVAVIDSGIRPGFPHLTLDGSVVACEDFVGDALGCSNSANNGHGTFVAGMISSNVVFTLSPASAFRNAILAECPGCFADPPAYTQLPMIGSAPLSSIHALRVFGPTGGAPSSRILQAIDRMIDLKKKFDAGDAVNGRDIRVCNMSLGGSTVFAGRDVFDTAVDAIVAAGIVPVVAASNTGPSSLTVGSPGTSLSALTVGAASLPHNERILRNLQFGVGIGPLYRPFGGIQTAYFSSRGPNADGRPAPDISVNGFANFGQGFSASSLGITIGSGTSYASPSVAGVAALLVQSFPSATARQIRNAIAFTGNPALIHDGSTYLDFGSGYVDALAARNLLATGKVPNAPPVGKPNGSVKVNIEQGTTLDVRDGFVQQSFTGLKPGQRGEVLYRVHPNTKQVIVTLSNVTPAAQQNVLFGDDILFAIHSAKTSSIGEIGDYNVLTLSTGGTFVVNNPETGIMRITASGDWTNAGPISASVSVLSTTEPLPQFTSQGKIANAQTIVIPVQIPAGTAQAEFRLGWREDWGSYPAHDLDLILVSPAGTLNVDAAALNNPEVATIANPAAGTWTAIISGFEVWNGTDKYEFRVSLDGKVVKQ